MISMACCVECGYEDDDNEKEGFRYCPICDTETYFG